MKKPNFSIQKHEDFFKNKWEKEPFLFENFIDENIIDTDEIFSIILNAAKTYQGNYDIIRFYHKNLLISTGYKLLPNIEETFNIYMQRLDQNLPEGFGLVINNAHQYSSLLFTKTKSLLLDLFKITGMPLTECDIALFIGNYHSTPFGIHVDEFSNLYCNVLGKKTLRFWPRDQYQGKFRDENQVELHQNSHTINGGPKDLIYWPSSYWHVAEGEGGLAASVSISALKHSSVLRDSMLALEELLLEVNPHLAKIPPLTKPGEQGLPEVYQKIAETIASIPPSDIAKYMQQKWLRRASDANMLKGLQPETPPPKTKYQLNQNTEILLRVEGPNLCLAANGKLLELPAHPGLLRFLMSLQNGLVLETNSDVRQFCGVEAVGEFECEMDEEGFWALVEQFKLLGIFEPEI
jgi:hypothetical protein